MYYFLFILLLAALIFCLFFHFKKKKIIAKIKCMDKCRKCSLLEELVNPFGYCYHCSYGFFSSTIDAWQRKTGYTYLYDYMAPFPSILTMTVKHGSLNSGRDNTASIPEQKLVSTIQTTLFLPKITKPPCLLLPVMMKCCPALFCYITRRATISGYPKGTGGSPPF